MKTKLLIQSNSFDETKYTFRINLSQTLHNITSIKLMSVVLPNSNYTVEQNLSDRFYVCDVLGNTHIIKLPEGYFTVQDLLTELSIQLNSLNIGSFTLTYNSRTFRVGISSTNPFSIKDGPNNINYNLGITKSQLDKEVSSMIGKSCVRLNSNKVVFLNLDNIPQQTIIPDLRNSCSFVVPVKFDNGNINFISNTDLSNQSLEFDQDGIDLSYLDVSLMRSDKNEFYKISSDWSFLIEVTYWSF